MNTNAGQIAGGETKQPKKNMKPNPLIIAILVGIRFVLPAFASDSTDTNSTEAAEIEALKKEVQELSQKVQALEHQGGLNQQTNTVEATEQIQDLDQKVRILARQREQDQEAAVAAAKKSPKLTVDSSGFSAMSADSNFVFSLKAVIQVDSRTFFDDNDIKGNDGFFLRRARPIFQGTVDRDFDFRFTPDFAPSTPTIFDAYGNYRYEPWLQLRAGKFKTPEGLEQLQEDVNTSFNERSLATDLVPNRDVGLQLWGAVSDGVLSYAAGIFNGVGDAQNSGNAAFENEVEFAGRLIAQPFKSSERHGLARSRLWRCRHFAKWHLKLEGPAINHWRHIARIHDGRTAAILRLQSRHRCGGGEWRALAAFAARLLLLRAVQSDGRICHFRPGSPQHHDGCQRRFAQYGLGSHRRLGVDRGKRHIRWRYAAASV